MLLKNQRYLLTLSHEITFKSYDVLQYTIIRSPISRSAPICFLDINLHMDVVSALSSYVSRNMYPILNLKLELIENIPPDGSSETEFKTVGTIFDKQYMLLNCVAIPSQTQTSILYTPARLILINPILYFYGTNNGFNKILTGTGISFLDQYEKYLDQTTPNTFNFIRYANKDLENNFVYQNSVIKSDNDLKIPSFLINNFKLYQQYSLYIFDDFRYNEDTSTKTVTNMLINLGSLNKLKKINLFEQLDVSESVIYVNNNIINDPANELVKANNTVIIRGADMQVKKSVENTAINIPSLPTQTDVMIADARKPVIISNTYQTVISKDKIQTSLIYANDSQNLAYDRYVKTKDLVVNKINGLTTYDITYCGYDLFQFDCIYKMNPDTKLDESDRAYNSLPVGIVNVFKREHESSPRLSHHCRVQFLVFSI